MGNNSDSSNSDSPKNENDDIVKSEPISPELMTEIKGKFQEIMMQGEAFSLSKMNSSAGLDFVSKLNDGQKDKLIDIFSKNEDNSITYHKARIEAYKTVEVEKIKSKSVGIKNVK